MDLSVCLTTYNHVRYIAQALDGVLAQRLPFEWEILVGEDDSRDGTREIVEAYARRHPHRIRPFFHQHPTGRVANSGQFNFLHSLRNARGRYIALLDGDDYWTSPDKLRRQLEFLDGHPTYSGSFHNVTIEQEHHPERNRPYLVGPQPDRFEIRDLASAGRNVVPTCSVVFRNGLFGTLPKWFDESPFGDWSLHLLNADHGPFAYIDEILGVYRVHSEGAWSGMPHVDRLMATINGARVIDRHFGYRYHREFAKSICRWQIKLALAAASERQYPSALGYFAKALHVSPREFGAHAIKALPDIARAVERRALRR